MCAGHSVSAEAAIHAMSEIFTEEETGGILLIDASNAFNLMNRFTALHCIHITVNEILLYLINAYRNPSRLLRDFVSRRYYTRGSFDDALVLG